MFVLKRHISEIMREFLQKFPHVGLRVIDLQPLGKNVLNFENKTPS